MFFQPVSRVYEGVMVTEKWPGRAKKQNQNVNRQNWLRSPRVLIKTEQKSANSTPLRAAVWKIRYDQNRTSEVLRTLLKRNHQHRIVSSLRDPEALAPWDISLVPLLRNA